MTSPQMAMPTRRVDMWFAGSSEQNRWTVFFRLILGIPQFIVLYVLYFVTFFVAIIGWFGALFTGRLPGWAHHWISGVVRWSTRVVAYELLLTDQYPPFTFEDQLYPARPMLPPPGGPLNRVSVFFRIILAVPAFVFMTIVQYGLTFPLLIVMWFVVLFRGSLPPALYLTYAAFVRYQVRFHSWFDMLTSEYPWGMLGDRGAAGYGAAASSPGYGAPPGSGAAPAYGAPPASSPPAMPPQAMPGGAPSPAGGHGAGPPAWPAAGPPAAPGAGPPPVPPPVPPPAAPAYAGGAMPPPSTWERSAMPPGETLPPWGTLVLEGSARGWMIFAIVWGAIIGVGGNIARTAGSGPNHHNSSYLQQRGPRSTEALAPVSNQPVR
jgi:Domain of unknown function (DUF4389)